MTLTHPAGPAPGRRCSTSTGRCSTWARRSCGGGAAGHLGRPRHLAGTRARRRTRGRPRGGHVLDGIAILAAASR
ncbi:hypothetical protein ACFQ0B_30495 [Nonomuraea thailandensis]